MVFLETLAVLVLIFVGTLDVPGRLAAVEAR